MSSRMRETKGHTGNRRSHHALSTPRLSVCSNCKEYHERHRACQSCGHYRGNQIAKIKTVKAEPVTVTTADSDES